MKTVFQTINSKLVLLEVIIIVTGLFIAFFSFSSIDKIKENHTLLNNVNTLKIDITSRNAEISNIFENDQYNVSLYKNEKINSLSTFNSLREKDSIIIANLNSNEYILEKSSLMERCVKIRDDLSKFNELFNTLIINVRDRGIQNYGVMGEFIEANNKIIEKLNGLNDFILTEALNNISTMVDEYGQSFEEEPGNKIRSSIDELISGVYAVSDQYPNLDINEIMVLTDLMKQKLEVLVEKNNILGFNSHGGVLKDIREISSVISEDLLYISQIMDEEIPESNKKTTQKVLLAFLIIFFAIAIYVVFLIKSFTQPIVAIKKYISKIELGSHPEPLILKNNDEFDDINKMLANVVESLKYKTHFATELGQGNLEAAFEKTSDYDTLGNALLTLQKSLQKAEDEDQKHREENERRRWANEGLAKFSEILRMNNDNTEMLCDSVIKNLVKYLNSSLGGIYLMNDENKENMHLYLASAFAYDRKKFLKDKITVGEGLVGSCALEKQTIYMTDIPDDYITITSGLGSENPGVLLIVPLNLENEVLGVLELAAFNKFEAHELEFVEKLADSIASTLASAKINERTQHLLEQSQKQAIEMAEQEEEMRQNMEELQATQEESARRESEMYGILHAINSTSYYFETDLNGSITDINERLLFILEMHRENVIGMHHSELTSMNKNSSEYIGFWDDLKRGNSVTKIQKYESINGNEIWLKQSYTPIFNKDGAAIKIVCISTDISETVELEKNIQKIERELFSQKNELNYIFDAINVSLMRCYINNDGKILDTNSNLEKVTGYAIKELLEKDFKSLLSKDQVKGFERIWENIVTGHNFSNILKFETTSNEIRLVKSNFKPIINEKNELVKVIYLGEPYNTSAESE